MATRIFGYLVVAWCLLFTLPFRVMIGTTAWQDRPGNCAPEPDDFDKPCESQFYKKMQPEGIEQLMRPGITNKHPTARRCLGGYIAVMYDCTLRIPIWAAMSLPSQEIVGKRKPLASRRKFQVDKYLLPADAQQKESHYDKSGFDRGHMIAAYYAGYEVKKAKDAVKKMAQERLKASYYYSNAVPQYGRANRKWFSGGEKKLIEWANSWIKQVKSKATLYILVGAIPSVSYVQMSGVTLNGSSLFLSNGNLTTSKGINVPQATWTGTASA